MRSAVSMLSLMRIGMPCSGPRGPLLLRSASSASAIASASGLSSMMLRSAGPRRSSASIRARYFSDERTRRVLARRHALLQVGDRRLFELERRGGLSLTDVRVASGGTFTGGDGEGAAQNAASKKVPPIQFPPFAADAPLGELGSEALDPVTRHLGSR